MIEFNYDKRAFHKFLSVSDMVAFGGPKTLLEGNIEQKLLQLTYEIVLFSYIDECWNVGYMHTSLLTSSLYIQGKV